MLQVLGLAEIGTVMADVQDAITTYAVATVIIAVLAFVAVQPHVVVIVLCGLALQSILTQVIRVMTAVMHDLQAADPLDLGFGPQAALDNQHVIQLPKALVCQAAAQVLVVVVALVIFADSKWERHSVVACVLVRHTLQATDLQIV